MIGAEAFKRLLMLGGILVPVKPGAKALAWNTRTNFLKIGTQHSDERVVRAQAKRILRAAKVRRAIAAGGYGTQPYTAGELRHRANVIARANDTLVANLKAAQ